MNKRKKVNTLLEIIFFFYPYRFPIFSNFISLILGWILLYTITFIISSQRILDLLLKHVNFLSNSINNLFLLNICQFTLDSFQALIEYADSIAAQTTKLSLNGQNIYNGCCSLRVDFSKLATLNVKFNNEKSRDYTNNNLPTCDMNNLNHVCSYINILIHTVNNDVLYIYH